MQSPDGLMCMDLSLLCFRYPCGSLPSQQWATVLPPTFLVCQTFATDHLPSSFVSVSSRHIISCRCLGTLTFSVRLIGLFLLLFSCSELQLKIKLAHNLPFEERGARTSHRVLAQVMPVWLLSFGLLCSSFVVGSQTQSPLPDIRDLPLLCYPVMNCSPVIPSDSLFTSSN